MNPKLRYWLTFSSDRALRLAKRDRLPVGDIFRQHYSRLGIPEAMFGSLWRDLAQTLEVSEEQLRPSDEFGGNLAPEKWNERDDGMGLLPGIVADKYKKAGLPMPDLATIKTIDDYIMTVAAAETKIRGGA